MAEDALKKYNGKPKMGFERPFKINWGSNKKNTATALAQIRMGIDPSPPRPEKNLSNFLTPNSFNFMRGRPEQMNDHQRAQAATLKALGLSANADYQPSSILMPTIPGNDPQQPKKPKVKINPRTYNPDNPTSIYVGDLDHNCDGMFLAEIFKSKFSTVVGAKTIKDPITRNSKGYGFVMFASPEEAEQAITEMRGFQILTRKIKTGPSMIKNPNLAHHHLNHISRVDSKSQLISSMLFPEGQQPTKTMHGQQNNHQNGVLDSSQVNTQDNHRKMDGLGAYRGEMGQNGGSGHAGSNRNGEMDFNSNGNRNFNTDNNNMNVDSNMNVNTHASTGNQMSKNPNMNSNMNTNMNSNMNPNLNFNTNLNQEPDSKMNMNQNEKISNNFNTAANMTNNEASNSISNTNPNTPETPPIDSNLNNTAHLNPTNIPNPNGTTHFQNGTSSGHRQNLDDMNTQYMNPHQNYNPQMMAPSWSPYPGQMNTHMPGNIPNGYQAHAQGNNYPQMTRNMNYDNGYQQQYMDPYANPQMMGINHMGHNPYNTYYQPEYQNMMPNYDQNYQQYPHPAQYQQQPATFTHTQPNLQNNVSLGKRNREQLDMTQAPISDRRHKAVKTSSNYRETRISNIVSESDSGKASSQDDSENEGTGNWFGKEEEETKGSKVEQILKNDFDWTFTPQNGVNKFVVEYFDL